MNSVRCLNKRARDYSHGKYESRLIISQDGPRLRLRDSANTFKGLQPQLARFTVQQIQWEQDGRMKTRLTGSWCHSSIHHCVQHHSTPCLAAWRVGLWRCLGAAADSSSLRKSYRIKNKAPSVTQARAMKRQREGRRESGWLQLHHHSVRLKLSRPPGQGVVAPQERKD